LNRKNEGAGKPPLAARITIKIGSAVLRCGRQDFRNVPHRGARAGLAESDAVVV
jgi:hypothetical protein